MKKNSLLRLLFIFSWTILLSACIKQTPNLTEEGQLKDNEGVLIARVINMPIGSTFVIHDARKTVSAPLAGIFADGNEYKVIPVKEGELKISSYKGFNGEEAFFRRKIAFNIEAGKMTYVGDIHVKYDGVSIGLKAVDNEDETMNKVKELYPWLAERFSFRKALIQN